MAILVVKSFPYFELQFLDLSGLSCVVPSVTAAGATVVARLDGIAQNTGSMSFQMSNTSILAISSAAFDNAVLRV